MFLPSNTYSSQPQIHPRSPAEIQFAGLAISRQPPCTTAPAMAGARLISVSGVMLGLLAWGKVRAVAHSAQ